MLEKCTVCVAQHADCVSIESPKEFVCITQVKRQLISFSKSAGSHRVHWRRQCRDLPLFALRVHRLARALA